MLAKLHYTDTSNQIAHDGKRVDGTNTTLLEWLDGDVRSSNHLNFTTSVFQSCSKSIRTLEQWPLPASLSLELGVLKH